MNVGREMRGLVQRGMMFGTLDGNARTEAIRRFEKGQRVTDIKPDLIKIYQDMLEILVKEDNPAYRSLKPQWDAMWAGTIRWRYLRDKTIAAWP